MPGRTAPRRRSVRSRRRPVEPKRQRPRRRPPLPRVEQGQPRSTEQVAGAQQRRAQLRHISELKRVRYCGHTMSAEAGVTLEVIENKGRPTAGLKTCGSVWCCPVCAAKIATRRADDLATVVRAVDDLGGSAFLLTLTMRHDRGDRLGLTSEQRSRRNRLEQRLADIQVDEANGWDVDERRAEADEIELGEIKAQEGCWDVLSYAWPRHLRFAGARALVGVGIGVGRPRTPDLVDRPPGPPRAGGARPRGERRRDRRRRPGSGPPGRPPG